MVRGLHEGSVKVAIVVGYCRVIRWLEASETHHPRFEGQYEPLISFQPTSLHHFVNSGFVSLEGRPNSWFRKVLSCAEQGRRSRPLDPSHGRTVGSEPPRGIAYRGFGGRKNFFSTAKSQSSEHRGLVRTSSTSVRWGPCG
jgi:hypothetical protein